MTKKRLQTTIDTDYTVIGMVSSLKDYRVCWFLNQCMSIDLVRQEDIHIDLKEDAKAMNFALFYAENELDRLAFYFFANKYKGDFLVPKLKTFDYFLLIKGIVDNDFLADLNRKISEIDNIQLNKTIENQLLKHVTPVIFE